MHVCIFDELFQVTVVQLEMLLCQKKYIYWICSEDFYNAIILKTSASAQLITFKYTIVPAYFLYFLFNLYILVDAFVLKQLFLKEYYAV